MWSRVAAEESSGTWRFRVGLICAAWATWLSGCTGSKPMGRLPSHELDLSVPQYSTPRPAVYAGPAAPQDAPAAWASPRNPRPWRYIVIHHSATDAGNAGTFDLQHRRRGWDELGYHFVIDNGQGGPDGNLEIGSRWRSQKWGAHCGGTPNNEYNNYGIGICLVGDFTRSSPSEAQLATLRRLVADLAAKYEIAPENIVCHCDAPNASTQCPGTLLRGYVLTSLRRMVSNTYAGR